MKQCENCLELNTYGATNCVICGEPLPVAQASDEAPQEVVEEVLSLTENTVEAPPEVTKEAEEPMVIELPKPKPTWVAAAIEIYHDSEAKVVHTHVIVNDITLVGREDPQRDVFPDIDLSKLEGVSASHVSREHLRILRQGNQFFLYIFHGSTGTQVNKEVIDEAYYGKKIEIQFGDRVILGGKVRLKLIKVS